MSWQPVDQMLRQYLVLVGVYYQVNLVFVSSFLRGRGLKINKIIYSKNWPTFDCKVPPKVPFVFSCVTWSKCDPKWLFGPQNTKHKLHSKTDPFLEYLHHQSKWQLLMGFECLQKSDHCLFHSWKFFSVCKETYLWLCSFFNSKAFPFINKILKSSEGTVKFGPSFSVNFFAFFSRSDHCINEWVIDQLVLRDLFKKRMISEMIQMPLMKFFNISDCIKDS